MVLASMRRKAAGDAYRPLYLRQSSHIQHALASLEHSDATNPSNACLCPQTRDTVGWLAHTLLETQPRFYRDQVVSLRSALRLGGTFSCVELRFCFVSCRCQRSVSRYDCAQLSRLHASFTCEVVLTGAGACEPSQ